ncbi:IPT/TIG domain-containing protein [Bradyrhizobium elkanii]|uniref:IPT/TIG domain-containing protein n=1 Tax=Bradyrhizobium elkanii TaxID=29448 RepID=UPI0004157BBA|nr:IPT/TIG domain-containing protein [Bradyrhizobium elkanii]
MDRIEEAARQQLADDRELRRLMLEAALAASDVQPTPTQLENDMAVVIRIPLEKTYDGSPIDPSSPDPTEPSPPELPPPTLASFTPTTAVAPATLTLTATGANFGPDCKIVFNGSECATTVVSSSEATCSVTGDVAATYDVLVRGLKGDSTTQQFTFTAVQPEETKR